MIVWVASVEVSRPNALRVAGSLAPTDTVMLTLGIYTTSNLAAKAHMDWRRDFPNETAVHHTVSLPTDTPQWNVGYKHG